MLIFDVILIYYVMMGKDCYIVVNYKEWENECIDFEENKIFNK